VGCHSRQWGFRPLRLPSAAVYTPSVIGYYLGSEEKGVAKNTISLIVVLGIIGLIVGYFIFAKSGSSYLPINEIIGAKANNLGQGIGNLFHGVDLAEVRSNILYSGLAGAGLGLVIGILSRRR